MIRIPTPSQDGVAATLPEDLSAHIVATIERSPGEEVRCVRVLPHCYRCNWWVRDQRLSWGGITTSGRIVKSRFLHATITPDGVLLDEERPQ